MSTGIKMRVIILQRKKKTPEVQGENTSGAENTRFEDPSLQPTHKGGL